MTIRILLTFFLCSAWALGGLAADAVERAETLRAINWVENPSNHARRGSKGELGPYQFRSQTWRMHTRQPFEKAIVRAHADEVAARHYEWIRQSLRVAGIDPSPFNVALAWNSGLGSVLRGEVPTVSYRYAERVVNLVEQQRLERRVRAEPAVVVTAAPARFDLTGTSALHYRSVPAPRFDLALAPPAVEPVLRTLAAVAAPSVPGDGRVEFAVLAAPRIALIR
jgi:hypothetical protein